MVFVMMMTVVVTVKMMMAWIVVDRSRMGLFDCWPFEKPQTLPSMHLQGRICSYDVSQVIL